MPYISMVYNMPVLNLTYKRFCDKNIHVGERSEMELGDRFKLILTENGLKQKELAKEIGVTESYISAILHGRNKNISASLASLIEQKYGYRADWVLYGTGSKKNDDETRKLSLLHLMAIDQVKKMSQPQIKAVMAFLNSLEDIERNLD